MRIGRSLVAALGLCAVFASGARAQEGAAPRPSAEAEVAFLSFRHAGLVDTVLSAVYDRDDLYLPLAETLRVLGVPVVLDLAGGAASGSYPDAGSRYTIDLAAGTARIGGRTVPLAPGAGLVGDLDLYLLPEALEQVFSIEVRVDLGELAVRVDGGQNIFPIVAAERRRRLRSSLVATDPLTPHAPLRVDRLRHRFYGGVFDYSFDSSTGAGADFTSFSLGSGFEAFGGDIEAGVRGTAAGDGLRANDARASWRYVFDDPENRISQLRLGSVTPAGLRAFDLLGVRVTNEPVAPRRVFAMHTVRGRTDPDVEVELFVNGQMRDYAVADGLGNYAFQIPLTYGRSVVSLRFYGQSGEFLREERGIPVPFGLVPDGVVDYTVGAGARTDEEGAAVLTRVAWGITDRITNAVGAEWIGAGAETPSELVFFNSFIARLTDGAHAALDLAPGAFARLTVEGFSSSLANAEIEATRFAESDAYNPVGDEWRFRLRAFSPFRAGRVGVTGRVFADWSRARSGEADATVELEAVASLGRMRQSLGLRDRADGGFFGPTRTRELLLGTLYNVSGHGGPLAALNGTLLRAQYAVGLHETTADRFEMTISRPLTRNTRVAVALERNFELDASRAEIRITYDGDPLLATLGLQRDATGTRLRQTVRGAVAFDPADDRFVPTKQPWIGRSGAAFRFFVDTDGDRAYSPGEELVDGGAVRFRETVPLRRGEDNVLRAVDLLAYSRYSVRIDDTSVRNPSLVPFVREFSFVTDPNSYKTIDVPFYVGGEVEGSVQVEEAGRVRPLAGARLRVTCIDGCEYEGTTTTFADGTYYLSALPPGRYRIALDADQLEAIGASVEPGERTFRLAFDPIGAIETGLDFAVSK